MAADAQKPGCRSGGWASNRWHPAIVFAPFAIGFWGALIYIHRIPAAEQFDRAKVHFELWATLIGVLCGFALAATLCFVTWSIWLARLFQQIKVIVALSWLITVLLVGGLVFASLFAIGGSGAESLDKALATQTRPITILAGICMVPGLVALMALRSLATDESNWQEPGPCRLRLLIRARAELRRLLATLGAFLALVVVATGMRRRALLALNPKFTMPPEQVLLYGLLFVVMLGLFYMAASSAIDGRAQRLIDEFATLPDPADKDFSEKMRRRNDLTALVAGGGSWRSFETTVLIAAPLLTALISRATSG